MVEHKEYRKTLSEQGKIGAEKRWKNSPPISPPNAKERKGKEIKEIDTSIFQEYIDNPENESITFYVIKYFLLLKWKPAQDETIESLRLWIKEVFADHEVIDA